jgi:hypothetical protein
MSEAFPICRRRFLGSGMGILALSGRRQALGGYEAVPEGLVAGAE